MKTTLADAYESYINWLVLWLFLGAINLAMEASAYLVDEPLRQTLRTWAQYPTRLGGLVILVAIFTYVRRLRRLPRGARGRMLASEYVTEMLKRSALVAFLVTFPLVMILDVVTNHTALPADFFIKLPGFSLAAIFSLCFFVLTRRAEHDAGDAELTR